MPAAQRLSVVMCVAVWGCSSSVRMREMNSASRTLKKMPPSSASAANASKFYINVERMCIAPLRGRGEEVGTRDSLDCQGERIGKNTLRHVIVLHSLISNWRHCGHEESRHLHNST